MGDSMKKWREFLKEEELEEKTRAEKEGVPLPSTTEALEKYVADDFKAPEYFMQFSDINKLGINPSSKYNTPLGIYSYPITKQIFRLFTKGKLPFAQDRKYIIVFKPKEDKNVIISLGKRNNGGIDDETYEAALVKLDGWLTWKPAMRSQHLTPTPKVQARPGPGQIWEIWGPGNPEILDPQNEKSGNSQIPNPFCPKCRQGLD